MNRGRSLITLNFLARLSEGSDGLSILHTVLNERRWAEVTSSRLASQIQYIAGWDRKKPFNGPNVGYNQIWGSNLALEGTACSGEQVEGVQDRIA